MSRVKKVFVIHKTHLDIGFTDTAANVLDRYEKEFIPQAIRTARICNRDGKRNFVWTTGSFLIRHYLEHAEDTRPWTNVIAPITGTSKRPDGGPIPISQNRGLTA